MTQPSWLPPLTLVNGPREDAITHLYRIFSEDFKRTGCELLGVPVQCDLRVLPGELYEEGFWHLVSREDRRTGRRNFDSCRAQRLSWCKSLIAHANDSSVRNWDDRVNRRVRTYLWLEEHDYVVVLERGTRRRGEIAVLITAYCVEGEDTRRKLRKSFNRRIA